VTESSANTAGPLEHNQPTSYRPGYEIAAERILEYIVVEELAPGTRLPTEKDLADAIQMSRTIVREAVKILSALGRLSVQKGRGIYVAEPSDPLWQESFARFLPADLDQVYQLFEFRTCVETETAKLAAERANPGQVTALQEAVRRGAVAAATGDIEGFSAADESFHAGVSAAAGNMFLAANVESIQRLQRQTTIIGLSGLPAG
jgi:GntR family transcriptional repressor for pyruvate dehydrogenase complex